VGGYHSASRNEPSTQICFLARKAASCATSTTYPASRWVSAPAVLELVLR
jgi:hypothetical protein